MSSKPFGLSGVDQYLKDHSGPCISSVSQYILRQRYTPQVESREAGCLSVTGKLREIFFKSSEDPIWSIIRSDSPSDIKREKERMSCFIHAMQPLVKRDVEVELLRLKALREKHQRIKERSKVSFYLNRKDLEVIKEDLEKIAPMKATQGAPKKLNAKIKADIKSNRKTTPIRLLNPATGKVELIKGNYQFLKRWVKEALVTEGLLPKIYKQSEISITTSNSIQLAIIKLANKNHYRC